MVDWHLGDGRGAPLQSVVLVGDCVVGVRGGVGASMVTSSISWLMAHEFNRRVALLDLDLHFGTGALTFALEPGRGLCDALDNPSRVDGLFIERAMIKESDDLCILGAEAPLNDPMSPDPSALGHLHTQLSEGFECLGCRQRTQSRIDPS